MLFSMLLSCAAVEPSETLVLAGAEGEEGLLLPLFRREVVSPTLVGGIGLLGLSIFTVVLSVFTVSGSRDLANYIGKKKDYFRARHELTCRCA
jgi:hypothetical protein